VCRRSGKLYFIFIIGVSGNPAYTIYEDKTECLETLAHKIQTPVIHPNKEYNIQNKTKFLDEGNYFSLYFNHYFFKSKTGRQTLYTEW
jgi:hypothetical protein